MVEAVEQSDLIEEDGTEGEAPGTDEAACRHQEVSAKGDRIVVERNGQPIAVVVPIDVYHQWKRSRAESFDRMRQVSEQANLSPEEADRLADEAVRAVRTTDSVS